MQSPTDRTDGTITRRLLSRFIFAPALAASAGDFVSDEEPALADASSAVKMLVTGALTVVFAYESYVLIEARSRLRIRDMPAGSSRKTPMA